MTSPLREQPASAARYSTDDARIPGGGRRYSGTEQGGPSTLGREGTQGMTVDYLAVLRRGPDGRLRCHIDMFTAAVRQAADRE
jgi:hypothetical protein